MYQGREKDQHYYQSDDSSSVQEDLQQHFNDDELHEEMLQNNYSGSYQQHDRSNAGKNERDISRIQKLYHETNNLSKRIEDDRSQHRTKQNRESQSKLENAQEMGHRQATMMVIVLYSSSMKYMENQLGRAKESNVHLAKKYEEYQEEVEKCHDQIARQANLNHTLQIQVERLENELEELALAHQELVEKSAENEILFERRIQFMNDEVATTKKQMQLKEEGWKGLSMANDQYKDKCYNLENEISTRIEEIDHLKSSLKKKEALLDQFYLNRGSETTHKIELEQLKEDNQRLLKLIKQTKEFQDFSNFVDDSGGKVINIDKENTHKKIILEQVQMDNQADEDQWAPGEAFKIANDFRVKHGSDLTPSLVSQLLSDLNKIWREREKKQISRIKQQCQNEILALKRQLIHRTPFDELTAKKNISRLKSKLTTARQELSKNNAQKEKQKSAPIGIDLIDNTLQIVTSMQQQKKELEVENFELKTKIQKLEGIKSTQEYEKSKYMEGAVWMGKKVSNEIERACSKTDNLIQEYHQRVRDASQAQTMQHGYRPVDIMTLQRAQTWFLEAIKHISFELYEESITMLESAVMHMEDAQGRVNDAFSIHYQSQKDEYPIRQTSFKKGVGDISNSESEMGDPESMFRATAQFQNV